MAEFVEVCNKDDVKEGQGIVVNVEGKRVALFNVKGEIYAINNTCIHAGGPLGEGRLSNDVVMCPWHGWEYNVKDGTTVFNSNLKVEKYNVKVEGDKVLVEKK